MDYGPDVLVLGGGGVLGEAWMMGLLAGIEDGVSVDLRECDAYVGTSAGSIVAARLVAGDAPRRPSSLTTDLELAGDAPGRGLAVAAAAAVGRASRATLATGAATFAPLMLEVAAPGGALARSVALRALPASGAPLDRVHDEVARSAAMFDGRLRIVAVDRGSGRRIVFGSPGAPFATVAQAVQASCTVPWMFAPVSIGGREYVDGGVWSPTNLDAAPAGRDTRVLCLNPTGNLTAKSDAPARSAFVTTMRRVSRSAATIEALALRRRGARVRVIAPNRECATAMGADLMAREPRSRVLSAGYRQGLAVAANELRW